MLVAAFGGGCAKVGCIGGDATCKVEAPCPKLTLTCDGASAGQLEVFTIAAGMPDARPGGTNALAAQGDVVLRNAFTTVVISGLGNQNYLDITGGSLIDLATRAGNTDAVNEIFPVTGILPGDEPRYTSLEIIDQRPDFVAVQLKGALDGHLDMPIYTRYELKPCDPGVRVRTEVLNASPDNQYWALADGFYWSKREPLPFTAGKGQGFAHPSFELTTINSAYQTFPFLTFGFHNGENASYAAVSCTDGSLTGFNSEVVSTAGVTPRVAPPRGWLAFDRFLAVTDGRDVDAAARVALKVREQVLGEKFVTLTGRVERAGGIPLGAERDATLLISEGSLGQDAEALTPWSQALTDKSGAFTLTVPAGKSYVLTVSAFGRTVAERAVDAPGADTDLGTLSVVDPTVASVRFEVTEAGGNNVLDSEIFVVPADDETKSSTSGSFYGEYTTCSPWLGAPPGPSPACNRVLVQQGVANAELPRGKYHLYAYHGPFWSLGHQLFTVDATVATTVTFQLERLVGLQPTGTLSADLHVHGAASFDSSIPDFDRVLSFAASELDVIVATDHDVVHDYGAIVSQLGFSSRMTTITGVETTGHVPWMRIPNYGFPLVIGHYIFWPLRFDPTQPRNGAPFDEQIEPGNLFTDAARRFTTSTGVIQLNHPWAVSEFGRDLGFPRAIKLDLRKDLPASDDGSDGRGVYVRKPKGAEFFNDAHHSQEVMNGSQNSELIQYRQFWFYLLNQGRVKTGTANSDSHSLVDSTVGLPRNLVWAGTDPGPLFDIDKFDNAIHAGRVLGTSGPIIEATVDGATGLKSFGLEPFAPLAGGKLHLKVTTAPWATVPEVRVVVNGQVVKTLAAAPLPTTPDYAFSDQLYVAYDGELALSELLDGVTGDAWVVVEAGPAFPATADLAGGLNGAPDGMPDTTDNNGDGKIDKDDVPKGDDYGPLADPPFPAETDPGFHFANITRNGYPYAFTNPFLLDRDGTPGFNGPGVKGGRP
ncbi:MAG: CehA/McbA family metallohydrolase [Archangiaceae bacterium]|nr:CehA/McbA family metallohydrolase [Archangiaceae bacterium]